MEYHGDQELNQQLQTRNGNDFFSNSTLGDIFAALFFRKHLT